MNPEAPGVVLSDAPPPVAEVQAAMARYLDGRGARLRVTECEHISGGFETFIYGIRVERFDMEGPPTALLPAGQRLILRIYGGLGVVERSTWEARIIERVRKEGVPVPPVYLYEPDPAPLGGPFLVIGLVTGTRMDQAALGAGPVAVVRMIRNFARAQAAIYKIDWPEGRSLIPPRGDSELGPLAWARERLLAARQELESRNLKQLLPVIDWLEAIRSSIEAGEEVLIHGDFHPLNVFVEGAQISGIIDWGSGGFANKHEDIGWTSMLIATATSADRKEDRKLAPFRTVARRVYLGWLWEACRLNRKQLRYGEVYAGLRWMLVFLPTFLPDAGPPLLNSDAVAFTTPLYVKRVRRFIEKRTKLKLQIEQSLSP
jgi:aminoglycoside phosphotransferase (APT) family kinase protein